MKNKSFNHKRRIKKQQPAKKNQKNDQFFESQVQRKCDPCEDEEKKKVQKKTDSQTTSPSKVFFNNYMHTIDSKGSSLSSGNRAFFEAKMNDDFSGVKLHKDKEAATAAKEIGAKAFAWNNHIVLNSESITEGSIEEKKILAHELKHIQQQKKGEHQLQMMPEGEESKTAEGEEKESTDEAKSSSMEKEAELEEENVMTPESVPDFQLFGRPSQKTVFGNSIPLQGRTTATYNGGEGQATGVQRTPVAATSGCLEGDCYRYTGQYIINYNVSTSVSLPGIPDGLRPCQEDNVRNAITNVLVPHEQEHVAAFNQYNGSVTLNIDYTGPRAGLEAHVQQMHDNDDLARMAVANAASAALDPFHINADMDCVDEVEPPTEPQPE